MRKPERSPSDKPAPRGIAQSPIQGVHEAEAGAPKGRGPGAGKTPQRGAFERVSSEGNPYGHTDPSPAPAPGSRGRRGRSKLS